MPLIPAFGKQKQSDLCKFKATLVLQSEFQDRQDITPRNPATKRGGGTTIKICGHFFLHVIFHTLNQI